MMMTQKKDLLEFIKVVNPKISEKGLGYVSASYDMCLKNDGIMIYLDEYQFESILRKNKLDFNWKDYEYYLEDKEYLKNMEEEEMEL